MNCHVTDLIMSDKTICQRYNSLPAKYLHSDSPLAKKMYKFVGTATISDAVLTDGITGFQLVTIDAYAYRQRHQETGKIVHLRTGAFARKGQNAVPLKLAGIVDNVGHLYVLVETANDKVSDIGSEAPVRVSGLYFLNAKVKRASAA